MKYFSRLFWAIPILIIFSFVSIACEHHPDNGEYLRTDIWNGFEFRQRKEVTDNQYYITLNKFKAVFNSDSFTDNEREQIKNNIDIILIVGTYGRSGGLSGGYGTADYTLISILCNSIKDEIEEILKNILLW
jgi:hypothetical protein